MLARHVAAHLHQVFAQLVRRMANTKHRIKAGDDGALRAGLAPEGLPNTGVGGYPFVDEATRECWVVAPAEDVRTNAVVVDIRVARLWHPLHRGEDAVERVTELVQRRSGLTVVAIRDRRLCVRARRKCGTGTSLNVHVNEDEPGLIETAEEVL